MRVIYCCLWSFLLRHNSLKNGRFTLEVWAIVTRCSPLSVTAQESSTHHTHAESILIMDTGPIAADDVSLFERYLWIARIRCKKKNVVSKVSGGITEQ
jgi:hypothetical protein